MEWTFGDLIWFMVALSFWVLVVSMFIRVFADIVRRDDVSGWGKAGWVLLIVALPFLGILIYVVARPTMTDQDRRIASAELRRGSQSEAARLMP